MSEKAKRTYVVVGVVAASVSAATAAYVFWSRSRRNHSLESVDALLDKCNDQVRLIEQRLGELPALA